MQKQNFQKQENSPAVQWIAGRRRLSELAACLNSDLLRLPITGRASLLRTAACCYQVIKATSRAGCSMASDLGLCHPSDLVHQRP
ncbi:UNVERIFIED_CONTAM: hypothetical protein Sradi_7198600 [Sesamum radiatum]|uniref:Uncharacterized protein n=1 Tax=Sesamum radiatum TaxID=300843 RepID=A0AAW2IRD2_SESRA